MDGILLSLAPAKFQHLPIIHHPDADKASNQYDIGNQKISSLSAVCDLGVVWLLSLVTLNGATMFAELIPGAVPPPAASLPVTL